MGYLFNNIFKFTLVIFLKIILFLFDISPDFTNTCLELLLEFLHLFLIKKVCWCFWLNVKINRAVIFVVERVVGLEDNSLGSIFPSHQVIFPILWLIIVMLQVLDLLIDLGRTAAFSAILIVGIWIIAFSEPKINVRLRVNGAIIWMGVSIYIRLVHDFIGSTGYSSSESWHELVINKWFALSLIIIWQIRSKLLRH